MNTFENLKKQIINENRITSNLAISIINLIEQNDLIIPNVEFHYYNNEIIIFWDFKEEETYIEISIDDTADLYNYFVKNKTKNQLFGKDDLELDELDIDLIRTLKEFK